MPYFEASALDGIEVDAPFVELGKLLHGAEPPQPRHDARDAAAAAREVEDDASAARERRRRVGAGLGRAHDLDGHVRACAETTPSI